MTDRTYDLSRRQAVTALRILYPIWAIVGMFSIMYVTGKLVVPGDAASTAMNIATDELLFRTGIVGSLITQLIHIVVVLVLYRLFAPVNRNLASLVVVFGLVGVPIAMLNELNKLGALLLVKGEGYLTALGADSLNALVLWLLEMNAQGILIATIFWGLWLFPIGYLILESGYFPRFLGYWMLLAGIGYVLDASTQLLMPSYADYASILFPIVQLLTIGEVVFMVWVLFKGAKLPEAEPAG